MTSSEDYREQMVAFSTSMNNKNILSRRIPVLAVSSLLLAVSMSTAASAADPTPSPSATDYPCAKPTANNFTVTPTRVAAGDPVHVSGSIQNLCYDSQASQALTVYAQRAQDASPVEVTTTNSDSHGQFAVDIVVQETETLSVRRQDGGSVTYVGNGTQPAGPAVVHVDRVSGSCAGVVALAAPPVVHLGDTVALTAQRSDTSTVTIKTRRRGTATYSGLPTSGPDANGRFAARYVANDDYAVYAAGERCDSPVSIVAIKPTITGPVTARRGTSVKLTVTGLPGAPVAVYFHKAGTTGYSKRRLSSLNASGLYATTYLADADYRYYAVVGNDLRMSNNGLTQVRG